MARRAIVMEEPPVLRPGNANSRFLYPGMRPATFITFESLRRSAPDSPDVVGGGWCMDSTAERVADKARDMIRGHAPVYLRYKVELEYGGMKVWADGSYDETWRTVYDRARKTLDALIAHHNSQHPLAQRIARNHDEYAAGMHGGGSR